MKIWIFVFSLFSVAAIGQINPGIYERNEKTVIVLGYGSGGGSIVGADIETLLTGRLGFMAGAGFIGANVGFNFHLKPKIRSPYLSVQLWQNGLSYAHIYTSVGPYLGVRLFNFLNVEAGVGYILATGDNATQAVLDSDIALGLKVGAFFPF